MRAIRACILAILAGMLALGLCGCAQSGSQTESDGTSQPARESVEREAKDMDEATGYIEYLGQASVKVVTAEGKVIYIDPYAGNDYHDAADLILVTHGHFDHNGLELIENRNVDCMTITQNEAIDSGAYQQFDLGFAKVTPVQAGFNRMHDVRSCVGYVVELTGGTRIYVTGDTSTTDDMRDGTLASMGIDYAFWCSDGVYNMDTQEASDAARMVGARVNIPYHNSTMNRPPMFDETLAESFDAPGALVLRPGDKIHLD